MNVKNDLAIVVPYYTRPNLNPWQTLENVTRGGFSRKQTWISYDAPADKTPHELYRVWVGKSHFHQFNLGPILHFYWCWRWILESTAKPWLMLVENDVRFNANAAKSLQDLINLEESSGNQVGVISLFTPESYRPALEAEEKILAAGETGWIDYRPGIYSTAGQCMCISRDVLKTMMTDPNWTPIDFQIADWTKDRNLPNWYTSPSLAQHISDFSSVKNAEWSSHVGMDYVD